MSCTHFRDGRFVSSGEAAAAPRGRCTGSGSRREPRAGRTLGRGIMRVRCPRLVDGLVTLQAELCLAVPSLLMIILALIE